MKKIAIIGAGPAGIEAASILARNEFEILLFEKSANPLANLLDKAYLFPNFLPAGELVESLNRQLMHENIKLLTDKEVIRLSQENDLWKVIDKYEKSYLVDAVLITTGYTTFDASQKEELGYGIYKGVTTSIEMEKMIHYKQIFNTIGETPQRIVFLQCVGSRDEKSGNNYCSKVCCVTAVKQAIEVRKILPQTEIYIFSMDLRMWGKGFEEM